MEKLPFTKGKVVGNYELIEELASGGTGCVYSARHRLLGIVRALKIMNLRESFVEGAIERWQREAVLMSTMQHGNIVRVHDAGLLEPEGLFWYAMDLLKGHTLRELMQQEPRVQIAPTLYYGSQIADALQAAHEIGVIHRDVKPENVFVTHANEVKVLDLGIAKVQGLGFKTTGAHKVRGTLPYMSPEHCSGQSELVDGRSDVYALGIVLYEMMAGWHPFMPPGREPTPHELLLRHEGMDPDPLPDVLPGFPEYVWTIVKRAVQKDPNARFQTMLDFGYALRDARRRALNAAVRNGNPDAAVARPRVVAKGLQSTAPLQEVLDSFEPLSDATILNPPQGSYTDGGTFRMPETRREELKAAFSAAAAAAESAGLLRPHEAPSEAPRGAGVAPGGTPQGVSPGKQRVHLAPGEVQGMYAPGGAARDAQRYGTPGAARGRAQGHAPGVAGNAQPGQGYGAPGAAGHAPQGQGYGPPGAAGQAPPGQGYGPPGQVQYGAPGAAGHAWQGHAQRGHPQHGRAVQGHGNPGGAVQGAGANAAPMASEGPAKSTPPPAGSQPLSASNEPRALNAWHGMAAGITLGAIIIGVWLGVRALTKSEEAAAPAASVSLPDVSAAPPAAAAPASATAPTPATAPAPATAPTPATAPAPSASSGELTEAELGVSPEDIKEMVEEITSDGPDKWLTKQGAASGSASPAPSAAPPAKGGRR
ncbi:MAG: protein kinase [Polyangiaceae bacterium]|nr:protein kinase [Polyangiaceae bacterium]